MALLGNTIVEAGWMRLSALLPHSQNGHKIKLRITPIRKADPLALSTATALYAGQAQLTAEDFACLKWLPDFAASGRQLLMCHALRMLEGWNAQSHQKQSLENESEVLMRLARSAGAFAANLDAAALEPLCAALQARIHSFLSSRTQSSHDLLTKAMTLIDVSRVIVESTSLLKNAALILDQALPHLVAADGGPTQHNLQDYVVWSSQLLESIDVTLQPASRNALDRARPFLSMLLGHDSSYCFNPTLKANAAILTTTPMRLAPESAVCRLSAGKSVAISVPHQLTTEAALHLSSHNHRIISASLFQHDAGEESPQSKMKADSGDEGHLLHIANKTTERTVFMSPKGDDIRIEDLLPPDRLRRWMHITLNPNAKFSGARNGTAATIALDGRNVWQLNLRGARFLPLQDNGSLIVETTAGSHRVNWALRRIVKSHVRNAKPDMPELPF
jgi:hypothetical protein